MSVEEAVDVMEAERESHFDPEIVDALMANLDQVLAVRSRPSSLVSPPEIRA
jgi:response regulator RpfG family c-di-GMP phosphodiesterase